MLHMIPSLHAAVIKSLWLLLIPAGFMSCHQKTKSGLAITGPVEMGSIEYAVAHLQVKLIMIMGHQHCGAVKAYIEGGEAEIKAIPVSDSNRLDDFKVTLLQ